MHALAMKMHTTLMMAWSLAHGCHGGALAYGCHGGASLMDHDVLHYCSIFMATKAFLVAPIVCIKSDILASILKFLSSKCFNFII